MRAYVRPATGGAARVVDINSPAIADGIRRGEIVVIQTVTREQVQAGAVPLEAISKGQVVVSDGSELQESNDVSTIPKALASFEENAERNERDARERKQVHERQSTDIEAGRQPTEFVFMENVGYGAGSLMTPEQFLASGLKGKVKASTLAGRHAVSLDWIYNGRVQVTDE